jgi:hypothetical protein
MPVSNILPQTTTLRPGLLVGLTTSIRGNVSYIKRDIETGHIVANGEHVAKWETERTISDPAEYARATKVRSDARGLIVKVCVPTAFGPICPEADAADLEAAIVKARKLCEDFNRTAEVTRVKFYIMTGRVASDDLEAVKAINGEVRDLLADMTDGVKNLDAKVIREAAAKAKSIGAMLTPDAQARVEVAIKAARDQATKIVAAGEDAAVEIDKRTIRVLTEARTAFLDMDGADEVAAPAAASRALDLEPAAA